jgi:NAD-dependent SIR2 family protein deacetylase
MARCTTQISTNSGIRDYRGPTGIWTEARKAGTKESDVDWGEFYECIPAATPTFTHR